MNAILNNHIENIKELCKQHHIRTLYAFGSVVRDDFNESSDIDLLVEFEDLDFDDYSDNYFAFAEKIEHLLDKKVDLLTVKSLKNPYFIQIVETSKKLLYAA